MSVNQLSTELKSLIGREHPIVRVSQTLKGFVQELDAPMVGAYQINCSDEAEQQCRKAFDEAFVNTLLPAFKSAERSAFRTINLGARYETGAVGIAEDHYINDAAQQSYKVLVTKVNSHVCGMDENGVPRYGKMPRYQHDSVYCGALHGLMAGSRAPFATELLSHFQSGGTDRVALLQDPERVDSQFRSLAAAIVNSVLQAQRAVDDIQTLTHHSPTLHLVVPCVTINRQDEDTEVLCGIHWVDTRSAPYEMDYVGLGDLPHHYQFELQQTSVQITE